jgi:uncharacterized protein YcbX
MHVKSLWRYPVKSLLGEELDSAGVTVAGIEGDRVYALRDGDAVLSAKRTGSLFGAAARYLDGHVEVRWPDGTTSRDGDGDLDAKLSQLSGREVVLTDRSRAGTVDIVTGPDSTTTEGPDGRFSPPQGTFFDSAPIHLLTTSSLAHLRALYPDGSVDERRFRPNIVVDTGTDAVVQEQGWIGREVSIGPVVVRVIKSCKRCVMTTHAQSELPQDRGILKTLARSTGNSLGVLAEVITPGIVRVNDPVTPG